MTLRPLHSAYGDRVEQIPFTASDGTELGLTRIAPADGTGDRPAVLVLHGLTASADMFTLPETRNLVDVLLDAGYEPWLLDWRGSCRLPYNEGRVRYTFDDVALYDIPEAVALVKERTEGRELHVVAHCIGAMCLSLSMAAGLVPGLAGVVAQGVFLTPKMSWKTRARLHFGGELLRSRIVNIPTDFKKVGMWSKYSLLFAEVSLGAECKDPNCQILHNDSWGVGGSLFEHDNLHDVTHDRLADLYGTVPMWILPHLRGIELAHTMMRYNDADGRYDALPKNALDNAGTFDTPLLLLSGSDNRFWYDSNKLCHEVLRGRYPDMDVRYVEVPGYGHLDAFIGRNAALDVFGHIVDFLDDCRSRHATA
ncbi:alpha/beta hydrolase [Streptomyces longispororuber]|uniref:alpha/beta hydrolase n=1 Tax=Streptomyces longispororuber TaxID=68230 RepID=UPI0036FB2144